MKRLNKNYKASVIINALDTNKKDQYIGAIVKFKKLENRGTYHKENTFEICGAQRVYGYNKLGQYGLIDGYRVFATTIKDDFGCACSLDELEIISMIN